MNPLADALRDLDAAKARVERDAGAAADAMRSDLIAQLLPVLDNLDRTIAAAGETGALVEGVALVRTQLEGVLRGYGLERFDAVAAPFDPAIHDAISIVRAPGSHNRVVDQLAAGFRFGGKLLRPAKVVVGRAF